MELAHPCAVGDEMVIDPRGDDPASRFLDPSDPMIIPIPEAWLSWMPNPCLDQSNLLPAPPRQMKLIQMQEHTAAKR